MIMQIEIREYKGEGLELMWDYGHILSAEYDSANNVIAVGGNSAGLISLSRHLLTLAQSTVPSGYHIHLDDGNSLQDGSCELIIGKI